MLAPVSRTVTVLGAQVRPVRFDPAATLAKLEEEVRTATAAFGAADLLLFPELYLTGDDPFAPGMPTGFERAVAEPIPGPTTNRVSEIAARAGRWLCAGSIFEAGPDDEVYNTAIVFDASGRLAATYRKLFPWHPFEATTPGDRPPPVIEVPGVGGSA